MKTFKIITVLVLMFIISNCTNKKQEDKKSTKENLVEIIEKKPVEISLYSRLGEAQGIASIVDDLMEIHKENPLLQKQLGYLFDDESHMVVVKQHLQEFLSTGSGGPKNYSGKELPEVHKGMNITEKEFITTVDDMLKALDKNNIDEETKKDVLFILFSLKDQVLGL